MTDTAQAQAPAETGYVDPLAEAAGAFKVALGQSDAPARDRDESGRFASAQADEQEIEDEGDAEQAEPESDIDDDADIQDEAADEAQPNPVDMPSSWAKEDAGLWAELPPEAQAKIAAREGQRDAAVNQKFQEAANIRKANEALVNEAANNRQAYAEAIDVVLSTAMPQQPPLSMLDPRSGDYNPDQYHLSKAQYEQTAQWLGQLQQQRQHIAAQQDEEDRSARMTIIGEIEARTRPAFFADVPELQDGEKAPAVLAQIVEYAVNAGIPEAYFQGANAEQVTSAELHIAWKAREYDRIQAAKGKVRATPAPTPRAAQPAVRSGVATPRAAVEATKLSGAMKRLNRSGSVEDGAAVFKQFMKRM
jgi:hypothetical protein